MKPDLDAQLETLVDSLAEPHRATIEALGEIVSILKLHGAAIRKQQDDIEALSNRIEGVTRALNAHAWRGVV